MKNKLLVAILLAILVVGCNSVRKSNRGMAQDSVTQAMSIAGQNWELIKFGDAPIDLSAAINPKIHFILNNANNRFSGYSGCNMFSGSYTLEEGNSIRFMQIVSTKKACMELPIDETEFLRVFDKVDKYSIHDSTLSLSVGKMAPMAVFRAAAR